MFALRFLELPLSKHCNSLVRNIWRKVVSTSKNNDFAERSPQFYQKLIKMMLIRGKSKFFADAIFADRGGFDHRDLQVCRRP